MRPLPALILFAILFYGCTGTKRLPADKYLCTKVEVKFSNPETVNHAGRVKNELKVRAMPKLNSKFLGLFRSRLCLYNRVKEPKKQKGFRYWLKHRIGEEPAYYSEQNSQQAALSMEKYLEDNGYFRSKVELDTLMKRKQVHVIYSVTTEGQYFVRNVILPSDTHEVSSIILKNKKRLLIHPRDAYNVNLLKAQRDKFATIIRSQGYYDFNREYIYYYADTALRNHQVDIYFRIKEPSDSSWHVKYYINDITVYPTYAIDDSAFKIKNDTTIERGVTVIQSEVFLKKKALIPTIQIKRGNPFSQKKHTYTINRFLDLGIFKFVNIRYEKTDSNLLNAIIQLTPANTQDIIGEINFSTTTSNFLGTGVSFTYTNRNLFRGGELLNVTGSVNAETQVRSGQSFINTLEATGRVELGFPRFILLFNLNYVSTLYYVPRTRFSFTETFQKRVEYYTLNSFIADYTYDWRRNPRIRHIFTPVAVNSIRLFQTTAAFDAILQENPVLRTSFDDVFIITKSYSFIYNKLQVNPFKSYGYFRGTIEMAGNVIYTSAKLFSKESSPYTILGRPFAQYSKIDADARYYLQFTRRHSLASRILAGIIIPYGNSDVTPYLKQFFIGGSTSVRAYRLRTLGPGSYSPPESEEQIFFPDQTGDIKLELNLEYRFGIVKFFKGALFADAGNIWLLHKDTLRPGAEFSFNRFYKEIAIGTGIGLRLDFNFFVIRSDVSFPLRKPELPDGERWTFNNLNFGSKNWRRDNLIWNIAIGYPF